MQVSVKYTYPENGTRNGRIYPPEVLEKAFSAPAFVEHCENQTLPVVSEDTKLIGIGTASLEDYRVVTIDAEVFDPTYTKILKEFPDTVGITLAGIGTVKYADDKAVVTDIDFTHAMFTPYPAVYCTAKIKED